MDGLVAAVVLLWVLVIALAIAVFALMRQVGVLFERVAPMGALITDAGPKVGETARTFELKSLTGSPVAIGAAQGRSQLVFFLSPSCPVCKKLIPALRSTRGAENKWLDVVLASDGDETTHKRFIAEKQLGDFPYVLSTDLGMSYKVSRLPYAVLIDGQGVIRAKGLVNNREQLDSLFNAQDLGVASIQKYLGDAHSHSHA
jgi:methylamine dehydrogenase accessory protein MauD